MKKRKSPILLVSILIVLGLVVILMNMPHYENPDAVKSDPDMIGKEGQTPSKAALAGDPKEGASKRPGQGLRGSPRETIANENFVRTKRSAPKVVPTDTQVNSGWYTPESYTH